MSKRLIVGLSAFAAAGLLSACSNLPPEQVLLRSASPDGRFEAMLMVCHAPPAVTSLRTVGAVFERQEGRTFGCDDVGVHSKTWFDATMQDTPSAQAETLEWVDGRAVFTIRGRAVVSESYLPEAKGLLELRVLEPPTGE